MAMKCLFHTSFYVVWFFKHVTLSDLARLVLYQTAIFCGCVFESRKVNLESESKSRCMFK